MKDLFTKDFDFTITDIILAHNFVFTENENTKIHLNGRKVSGVVYCISGSAIFSFTNSQIELHPGEYIFLPKSTVYSVRNPNQENFHHITINFTIPSDDLTNLINWNYNDFLKDMVIQDTFGIKEILERLLDIWNKKKNGYRVMAKALLYEIMYTYFKQLAKKNHNDDYDKLKPAKRILDEQYNENISVTELASLCNFSETHFRRLFKKTFHCSPSEYRLNRRLLTAKELLLSNEFSVSEIAVMVGYDNANFFSRIFKTYVGMTPSEYIRKPLNPH